MERLHYQDTMTLQHCIRELYTYRDPPTFPTQALVALQRVVPAVYASYAEFNTATGQMSAVLLPPLVSPLDTRQLFETHLDEHPLIAYYQRTGDGQAIKISDFLTRRTFRRLALYQEHYRHLGVDCQMAIAFGGAPSWTIGFAFARRMRDFSERERRCLNCLRPHLAQAYHNTVAVGRLREQTAWLHQELALLDRGVILLTADGIIEHLAPHLWQWLREYFGAPMRQTAVLPEQLRQWVGQQLAPVSDQEMPPLREPLLVMRDDTRLIVRLVTEVGKPPYLLLHKQQLLSSSIPLQTFGLTPREAEVLFWVVQGKTNSEVAGILGITTNTVRTNLNDIYPKLGVGNRFAAIRAVTERFGLPWY